jgi:RNA polymerase sigma factor (sigma-70 family)
MADPHLAQDIAQQVFTVLAQKANTLGSHIILSGWLYRVTCHVAARTQRGEFRRRQREQVAVAVMNDAPSDSTWQEIQSLLDEAMSSLGQRDRDAVLLRYFENKSLQEVGAALGSSEDAAQKRLARAVEKLRAFFGKRGKALATSSLITAITLGAIQPAPATLISTISAAALASTVAGTSTALALTTLNLMSATTIKTTVVATAILTASVMMVVQYQRANRLRQDNESLQAYLQEMEATSVETSNQLHALTLERENDPRQTELVRLRGEVSRLRGLEAEVARQRNELARLAKSPQISGVGAGSDPNAASSALFAYLGEAVPPPPNLDPAYTKEGLLNAIQQAAQLAAVSLKRVEIETSEFPFLVGLVCESEADFEKLTAQLKNIPAYEYHGSTGSRGTSAFNITPYRSYPSDAAQRISRRTLLRTQMFFDQLGTR